jgi:hypothetical protein
VAAAGAGAAGGPAAYAGADSTAASRETTRIRLAAARASLEWGAPGHLGMGEAKIIAQIVARRSGSGQIPERQAQKTNGMSIFVFAL